MSILDEMSKNYKAMIDKLQMPDGETNEVADKYMQLSEETLLAFVKICSCFS